ncbi:MAG TPA: alkaline phosphatase family protein [Candidatus Polarisedimenticolia bacterium]|jgi:predicted AlkP superfamily phosphohydrolase/phosphomutase/tetratricopeptide (TPR) repeat protein|nr:alkaline phosphatase family protein [Candidatus Polarisedimenticolia bacterium]
MTSPAPRRLVLIALLVLLIAAVFVRIVPAKRISVLQNRVGRSNPLLLSKGVHWRIPGWEAIYVYSAEPLTLRGEIPAISKDRIKVAVPFEFRVRLDDGIVLKAHRERAAGEDAPGWIRRQAEGFIVRIAKRTPAYQLWRENLPSQQRSILSEDLKPLGLVEDSLRVGSGKTDPKILASYGTEKLAAMRRNTGAKIAVIGLDGADWDFALPMIRKGELPNLARLRKEGAYGEIRTNNPPLSPLLWTTIATGKSPDVHGINDFLVLDAKTRRMVPISSEFRKVKAAWNIASDAGLTTEFVAWWATWPAEPVRGIMVSDRVSYSLFSFVSGMSLSGKETFPEGYFKEIQPFLKSEAAVTLDDISGMVHVTPAELAAARTPEARRGAKGEDLESLATLIRVVASTENYSRIAQDLLRRKQPDLFAVYFQGIDEVSHRFAHLEPPRMPGVPAERYAKYSQAVAGFYRFQDRILGEVLRLISRDTTLILLSDHGFDSGESRPKDFPPFIEGQPGLWHAPFGMLVLHGAHVKPGPLPTSSLYDVLPTILDLLGLPPAEDLPGRSLRVGLDPGFVGGGALPRISSYEAYGDPLRPAREGESEASGAAGSEAIVETLRSLGYVGAPPEPKDSGKPGASGAVNAATTALYHANLASILAAKGDLKGAEAEHRLALQSNPDTVSALLGLARIEEMKGHPDQALALLQRIVSRGLKYEPHVLLRIAELFHKSGRDEDGLAYFDRIAGTGKNEAMISTARGVLYSRSNQPQKAEDAFRRALAEEPLSLSPMEELFVLYDQQGRVPELIPELQAAIRREEGSFMHHNWLGLAYRRQGDLGRAEEELRRAIELGPDQVGPAANLGSIYLQDGRVDEAAKLLEKALGRDAASAEVRTNLIVALGRLGQVDKARDLFEEGIRITRRPSLYNAMAFAYQINGRPKDAAGLLKVSLKMDPHQADALRLLRQAEPAAPVQPR